MNQQKVKQQSLNLRMKVRESDSVKVTKKVLNVVDGYHVNRRRSSFEVAGLLRSLRMQDQGPALRVCQLR